MRRTKFGWLAASASVLGLVGCLAGESPIVGTEGESGGTGGGAGTGGSSAMGGSSMAGGGPVESSSYFLNLLRLFSDEDVRCLPRRLQVGVDGQAACTASVVDMDSAACDCSNRGRTELSVEQRDTVLEQLRQWGLCDGPDDDSEAPPCADLCVCDVPQAEGANWTECELRASPSEDATGWCYVAPDQGVGSPELVADCSTDPKARIRFLNDTVMPDELVVLACHDSMALPGNGASERAGLGEPCLPSNEYQTNFSSHAVPEVTLVTGSDACASNLCLVNHFQGRVSCPYGQTEEQAANDPQCFLPGSNVAVTVAVEPQLRERLAETAATCSCRCDGPGDGPFCACGDGMECAPLIEQIGLPGDEQLAGSYCIPSGAAYDPTRPPIPTLACYEPNMDCGDPHPY